MEFHAVELEVVLLEGAAVGRNTGDGRGTLLMGLVFPVRREKGGGNEEALGGPQGGRLCCVSFIRGITATSLICWSPAATGRNSPDTPHVIPQSNAERSRAEWSPAPRSSEKACVGPTPDEITRRRPPLDAQSFCCIFKSDSIIGPLISPSLRLVI